MLSPLALCGTMLLESLPIMVFRCYLVWFAPSIAFSQGETTSAIVGKVTDATGAAMPAARVSITNSRADGNLTQGFTNGHFFLTRHSRENGFNFALAMAS